MAVTTNLNITKWTALQNQPEVPVNAALDILDGLSDVLTHNMASDANYTLGTTGTAPFEWQHLVIRITDTSVLLTTGRDIIVPTYTRAYLFINKTAQPLTIKKSTGTGVTVAPNNASWVRCDGTNVIELTPAIVGQTFTQTADKTVVNTVTETTLVTTGVGSVVLPANTLSIGKTVRLKARGINSTDASAGTLTFRFKLGSTTVVATPANTATNSLTNRGWDIDVELTCRTVGASGTVRGQGKVYRSTGAGSSQHWMMASTSDVTIDTTAAQTVDVTVQWGTASASNTLTCTNLTVEVLN